MKFSVEKKEGIECKLKIELFADDIDTEISKRINKISKNSKMDGFRPNKVPLNIIKKKYGSQIRLEVVGDLLSKAYNKTISDKNLTAAGVNFEITQNKEGKNLKCDVNIEVFPEINISNLEKIEIKKPVVTIGNVETEKVVNNIRQQFAIWHEIKRPVLQNDKVVIDFIGHADGKEFEGSKGESFELTIGSKHMIPGFEEGIINMEKNQTKKIMATFPKNYHIKELEGRKAQFDVSVTSIRAPTLPELDKIFFGKLGFSAVDINSFYKEVKEKMMHEISIEVSKRVKYQVFSGLSEYIDVEVPKCLVKTEVKNMKDNFIHRSGNKKLKLKFEEISDDLFKHSAEKRVKISLILKTIAEQQNFQANQESINTVLEEMTAIYGHSVQMRKRLEANEQVINNIKSHVIEDHIVSWVVSQSKISEYPEDFFNLVQDNRSKEAMDKE